MHSHKSEECNLYFWSFRLYDILVKVCAIFTKTFLYVLGFCIKMCFSGSKSEVCENIISPTSDCFDALSLKYSPHSICAYLHKNTSVKQCKAVMYNTRAHRGVHCVCNMSTCLLLSFPLNPRLLFLLIITLYAVPHNSFNKGHIQQQRGGDLVFDSRKMSG